jgi:protein-disulfide isomerase
VEYSDLECPFCIRHFNDKTIANTVAAFEGKVNHIFKVVQGVNHPGTEYKSLATLCAAKLKGAEAYTQMYQKIFAASTTSAVVPNAKVEEFAKELKVNTSDLAECVTK